MNRALPLLLGVCVGILGLHWDAHAQSGARNGAFRRPVAVQYEIGGVVRDYIDAVTRNWLLKAPESNPGILEMFADRDKQPPRNLLPWSGEFAGKYLTGGIQIYRLTQDPALKTCLEQFVSKLVRLQADDGYLGPFPPDNRLEGRNGTWDAWGHYHLMLGLLLWHEETRDDAALSCAVRIGDLLCRKFLNSGKRVVETGNAEMNHAVVHSLCLLHHFTNTARYLELARQIIEEFSDPRAGDYVWTALAGKEFFATPKPRWESLHPIQGIAELHLITGDKKYRTAFEHLWWSIAKLDRHNNGGFSSGEQAQGNPYHPGAIETCCTVAWIAMSVDMLRLTGNSIVADELELSTLNQVLGYQHPSGRFCTYNTPMDGMRRKSTEEIGFQIRPGTEEINCCSANAPRGFGLISEWALMSDGSGLIVNWYGPSKMTARVQDVAVTLKQDTKYPRTGKIVLHVSPERNLRFPLKLRIPHWSRSTTVLVNGERSAQIQPGSYLLLDREWKRDDTVQLNLDMSLHCWVGEKEAVGKASLYRGPLLLIQEMPRPNTEAGKFSPQWKSFGAITATNESGASFESAFEGSAVIWDGQRFDDAGLAEVMIDGERAALVDQYSPARGLPFSWERKGLQPGRHTIRITVLGQRNPNSKGQWINVGSIAPPAPPAPVLDALTLDPKLVESGIDQPSLLTLEVTTTAGNKVRLRDYGTGGWAVPYLSWLSVQNVTAEPFSKTDPLRSAPLPQTREP